MYNSPNVKLAFPDWFEIRSNTLSVIFLTCFCLHCFPAKDLLLPWYHRISVLLSLSHKFYKYFKKKKKQNQKKKKKKKNYKIDRKKKWDVLNWKRELEKRTLQSV